MRCKCGNRGAWRVVQRNQHRSTFSGGHRTLSAYSEIVCARYAGGCGSRWRTKARYVAELPDGGPDCRYCFGKGRRFELIDEPGQPTTGEERECVYCAGTGEGPRP